MIQLRSFVFSECDVASAKLANHLAIGSLCGVRYNPFGRLPTSAEWHALEADSAELARALTCDLRKKYRFRSIPIGVHVLTSVLLVNAMLAIIVSASCQAVASNSELSRAIVSRVHDFGLLSGVLFFQTAGLISCLFWLGCLGGLGSIAFISVNALSIQSDATFDITYWRFIALRVLIGAVFSILIALPLSWSDFQQFCLILIQRSTDKTWPHVSTLILPFVLGFSTSLVLKVLNKILVAAEGLFGVAATPKNSAHTSP